MYSMPQYQTASTGTLPMQMQQTVAAPGFYGAGSASYAPGMTTQQVPQQQFTTQQMQMQAPMAVPQQQFSYAPAQQQQVQALSPRGFGGYGGSGTYAAGGGSGRFMVGGGSGQYPQGNTQFGNPQAARADRGATPTWNPPELRGVDAMSQQLMSPGGSATAPAGGMALGGQRGAPGVSIAGMPTPPQIVAQQTRYALALDQQLATGVATLEKERDLEKQMLKFTCEKDIALFTNAATEKFVEQAELVDERTIFAVLELKKAAVERKLQLDAQANGLKLDYEMKSVQVEWQSKWNAFEASFAGQEQKLEAQFAAQEAIMHTGTGGVSSLNAASVPNLR